MSKTVAWKATALPLSDPRFSNSQIGNYGPGGGNRSPSRTIIGRVLCHLRYSGNMVRTAGLEPAVILLCRRSVVASGPRPRGAPDRTRTCLSIYGVFLRREARYESKLGTPARIELASFPFTVTGLGNQADTGSNGATGGSLTRVFALEEQGPIRWTTVAWWSASESN